MVGILIAAHQNLGAAFVEAAEGIVGPMEGVASVSLRYDEPPQDVQRRLEKSLRKLDCGEGLLILTDMFGGTPTNISLPFLMEGKLEILTGVNLPMVLKAHAARQDMTLSELAVFLRDYGARNIVLASEVWKARPQSAG